MSFKKISHLWLLYAAYGQLHLFASSKSYDQFLWYVNRSPCFRVPAFASFPSFTFKDAKIAQFESALVTQHIGNGIERLLYELSGLYLGDAKVVSDGIGYIFFCGGLGH